MAATDKNVELICAVLASTSHVEKFRRALSIVWSLRLHHEPLPKRHPNDVAGSVLSGQLLQRKAKCADWEMREKELGDPAGS
jgi:hypothetical protein